MRGVTKGTCWLVGKQVNHDIVDPHITRFFQSKVCKDELCFSVEPTKCISHYPLSWSCKKKTSRGAAHVSHVLSFFRNDFAYPATVDACCVIFRAHIHSTTWQDRAVQPSSTSRMMRSWRSAGDVRELGFFLLRLWRHLWHEVVFTAQWLARIIALMFTHAWIEACPKRSGPCLPSHLKLTFRRFGPTFLA